MQVQLRNRESPTEDSKDTTKASILSGFDIGSIQPDYQQQEASVPQKDCRTYENCDAPLCPIAEGLQKHSWYRGEPICTSRQHASLPWVKRQKRLQALKVDDELYFTVAMLNVLHRATKSTRGADPDSPGSETRWLAQRGRP